MDESASPRLCLSKTFLHLSYLRSLGALHSLVREEEELAWSSERDARLRLSSSDDLPHQRIQPGLDQKADDLVPLRQQRIEEQRPIDFRMLLQPQLAFPWTVDDGQQPPLIKVFAVVNVVLQLMTPSHALQKSCDHRYILVHLLHLPQHLFRIRIL